MMVQNLTIVVVGQLCTWMAVRVVVMVEIPGGAVQAVVV
jgi:hypothetical protein